MKESPIYHEESMIYYKGYAAHLAVDAPSGLIVGHVTSHIGRDEVCFEGKTVEEAVCAFHSAMDCYLERKKQSPEIRPPRPLIEQEVDKFYDIVAGYDIPEETIDYIVSVFQSRLAHYALSAVLTSSVRQEAETICADEAKEEALEKAGFQIGDYGDFLNLTPEEREIVEERLRISRQDRKDRKKK